MLIGNVKRITGVQASLLALMVLGLTACGSGTAPARQNVVNDGDSFDVVPPPSFTRGLLARAVVTPLYPIRARTMGVEGWVLLSFTVDEDGVVLGNSIRVLDEEPRGQFDLSAINAARRLEFDNSRGEPVEDVRYVFRFELEELNRAGVARTAPEMQFRELIPRRFITPAYPPQAEQQGIQGHVVVQFTVTTEGAVANVRIAESVPSGVFDNEALVAAGRLRFEPRLIFGSPVAVQDVTYRFDWRLPQ